MRHIVAILDPRTGSHRGLADRYLIEGEERGRVTVPGAVVPGIVQHLNPAPHEAALVFNIPDNEPPAPPPRPTLKAV